MTRFCWHTLECSDPAKASDYYAKVIGWDVQEMPTPAGTYRVVGIGDQGLAGIAPTVSDPSHWVGYVLVDDVDATCAKAVELGGKVVKDPWDMPNVGRFATLQDDQGATFRLMKPAQEMDHTRGPKTFHWDELWSADPDKSLAFYTKLFGFTTQSMPMGNGGIYQMLVDGDTPRAGIMKSMHPGAEGWVPWIDVANVDEAGERVVGASGQVVMGPMEAEGVGRMIVTIDATGAMLGLITPADG